MAAVTVLLEEQNPAVSVTVSISVLSGGFGWWYSRNVSGYSPTCYSSDGFVLIKALKPVHFLFAVAFFNPSARLSAAEVTD